MPFTFFTLFFLERYACHRWVNYSSSHLLQVLIFSGLGGDDAYPGLLSNTPQQSLSLAVPVEIRTNTLPSIRCSNNSSCLNSLALLLSLPPFPNEVSCWLHLFFIWSSPLFFFSFRAAFKTKEQVCELRRRWSRTVSYCSFVDTAGADSPSRWPFFPFHVSCFPSTKRAHYCGRPMSSIHLG